MKKNEIRSVFYDNDNQYNITNNGIVLSVSDTTELWVPVQGFESRYMISNKGRIISLGRDMVAKDGYLRQYPDKMLKLNPKKSNGYVYARLYYSDGKNYNHISVHRLVAKHYIPNPNNHPVVNHIDISRSNNDVENLEWTTVSGNVTHKKSHIRAGAKRRKNVYQYTADMEFIYLWPSVDEAHKEGFNKNLVRKVCLGIRKRYKGFIWAYN